MHVSQFETKLPSLKV